RKRSLSQRGASLPSPPPSPTPAPPPSLRPPCPMSRQRLSRRLPLLPCPLNPCPLSQGKNQRTRFHQTKKLPTKPSPGWEKTPCLSSFPRGRALPSGQIVPLASAAQGMAWGGKIPFLHRNPPTTRNLED